MAKYGGRYWVFHCAEEPPLLEFHEAWDGPRSAHLKDLYEMSKVLIAEIGRTFVSTVPTDPDKYRKWLHTQREFYSKWNTLLKRLLCISIIRSTISNPTILGLGYWKRPMTAG